MIVPVQCEYLSLRGLVQLENTLTMIRENLNPTSRSSGILPTMFDGRTLHAREAIEILRGELRRPRLQHADPQDDPLRRGARCKGSSVLEVRPDRRGREAYRDLAKEVLNGAKAREHA